jgi:hypothetical protein
MLPQFLIIGLSQLTEPLIPSYIVKLEHYDFEWTACLEEAVEVALHEDSVLDYTYLMNQMDYSFTEWLMETLEERQERGLIGIVAKAFADLTWVYYQHFYPYLKSIYGQYSHALDSVHVVQFIEANQDVVLEFEWDRSRL